MHRNSASEEQEGFSSKGNSKVHNMQHSTTLEKRWIIRLDCLSYWQSIEMIIPLIISGFWGVLKFLFCFVLFAVCYFGFNIYYCLLGGY